jgi:hypothetical protein
MDTGTMLFAILIAVALAAIVIFVLRENGFLGKTVTAPPVVVVKTIQQRANPSIVVNPDPRFAPLSPEQSYEVPADMRNTGPIPAGVGAIPINTYTRGIPATFQQIGVLTAPGGTDMSATPTRTLLPLFGRTIDSNRNRWNYYTRSDGMNPVQVPVQFKRRNCEDDNGCDEISDGDSVGVPLLGNSYVAKIYRYSTPRYLPVF